MKENSLSNMSVNKSLYWIKWNFLNSFHEHLTSYIEQNIMGEEYEVF